MLQSIKLIVLPAVCALLLACLVKGATSSETEHTAECGQLCVYYVARLLGAPVEMKQIKSKMPVSELGNSMKQLQETLAWIGIDSQGRRLSYGELSKVETPVIAHFDNHFAVVRRILEGRVEMYDGAGRRVVVREEDFRRKWDGTALVANRAPKDTALPAFLPTATEGSPRIRFETMILDAGEIENPGLRVPFRFVVANVGDCTLEIKRIRVNCRCAVAQHGKRTVEPGGESHIEVSYMADESAGAFEHTVFVESNDPVCPVAALIIAGNTLRTVISSPHVMNFGEVVKNTTALSQVVIHYTGDDPIFPSVSDSHSNLTLGVTPVDNASARRAFRETARFLGGNFHNKFLITGWFDGKGFSPGRVAGVFTIETGLARTPTIDIPYVADIVSPVRARPTTLFFGELHPGKESKAETVISLRNGNALRISALRCEEDAVKFEYSTDTAKTVLVHASVAPGMPGQVIDAVLQVRCAPEGSDTEYEYALPVYGFFQAQ